MTIERFIDAEPEDMVTILKLIAMSTSERFITPGMNTRSRNRLLPSIVFPRAMIEAETTGIPTI